MTERILLDGNAAAAYLGIAKQTLAKWRVEGRGPPYLKLGGAVRYAAADLNAWIQVQRRRSTTDPGPDGVPHAPARTDAGARHTALHERSPGAPR
jgi:predicted DNA-binding transcriptional regulator AlpA